MARTYSGYNSAGEEDRGDVGPGGGGLGGVTHRDPRITQLFDHSQEGHKVHLTHTCVISWK